MVVKRGWGKSTSYLESVGYVGVVFLDRFLGGLNSRRDVLVCGLRIADGIRVLLGEEGHSDADFFLIFSYDRSQNGNEILFFLGILLIGYVPTELADEIDVVHEAGSPSKGHFLTRRKVRGIQEFLYGIEQMLWPLVTAGGVVQGASICRGARRAVHVMTAPFS